MAKSLRFINGQVFLESQFSREPFAVQEGKIVAEAASSCAEIDCKGALIIPGFIDLQINGGFGVDFTSNPEELNKVAKKLPSFGVTSFLMTVISQPLNRYQEYIDVLKGIEEAQGACCLGLHLEGPHINPERAGAHNLKNILEPCAIAFWENFLHNNSVIKMMTLAPEVAKSEELLKILHKESVVAACGHTTATCNEMQEAANNGLTMVTHLFNAMGPLHQRAPGAVGYTLGAKRNSYSLIVDGCHLHPLIVAMSYNAHPKGAILVSDASSLLGVTHSKRELMLGDQKIVEVEGASVLQGTKLLAGSRVALDQALHNFCLFTGATLEEALPLATSRPAELIGLGSRKGKLLPGFDADFLLVDYSREKGITIREAYVGGVCCYKLSSPMR